MQIVPILMMVEMMMRITMLTMMLVRNKSTTRMKLMHEQSASQAEVGKAMP